MGVSEHWDSFSWGLVGGFGIGLITISIIFMSFLSSRGLALFLFLELMNTLLWTMIIFGLFSVSLSVLMQLRKRKKFAIKEQ